MLQEDIIGFHGKYRWLSNFQRVDIMFEYILYPSVEHAYVAAKTLDEEERIKISKLTYAGDAKKYGRNLKIRKDWDSIKENIMLELTREKYRNDMFLTPKLLGTGNCLIVEDNTWNDTFWGVCNGVGENKLGKIIMKVREELRNGLTST